LREVERDGNLRNIAIVYFLLYTGVRVSELVALNQDDVTIGERSGERIGTKREREYIETGSSSSRGAFSPEAIPGGAERKRNI
jgi:integrase